MGGSRLRRGRLEDHPNYKRPQLQPGESPIAFAIRCAAHLVSPPTYEGENTSVKCTDVAREIRELAPELERVFNAAKGK